jgi:alpha-tubulin suppressor-like RCC1 family protein
MVFADDWKIIPTLNNVIKIAAGHEHSLFLTADEKVYACGQNDQGQLGLGHTNNVNIPTLVIDLRE